MGPDSELDPEPDEPPELQPARRARASQIVGPPMLDRDWVAERVGFVEGAILKPPGERELDKQRDRTLDICCS